MCVIVGEIGIDMLIGVESVILKILLFGQICMKCIILLLMISKFSEGGALVVGGRGKDAGGASALTLFPCAGNLQRQARR